ncbi:MAG: hypothetical protein NTV93_08040 [Verrucomicrobia bacterium]|nr:hypothetical protein [Verrucomicrobiota bacterium]
MPWLLAGFALVYYALYANAGLNLGGEGGTAGVVAMRLMAGQRPIVDTFLGYNVLWFLPVAGLFELTGPNYLALRWYFFAICTASGLLTYFVVHGYTRNAWFSAIPAMLAILIPGMLFRNYMPFLGILNAFLLTSALVLPHRTDGRTLAWAAAAGLGLGLTFLFRIDLGMFCLAIFLGLCLLYPLGEITAGRVRIAFLSALAGLGMAFMAHVPFAMDANARGYGEAFLSQYTGWAHMLQGELLILIKKHAPASHAEPKAAAGAATHPPASAPRKQTSQAGKAWEDRGALARAGFADVWEKPSWSEKSLALSTYLPIAFSTSAILAGSFFLFRAIRRKDPDAKFRALYPLTVIGCSLTLFPQYFFFRPDTVHIAEMMVPFFAALATVAWACGRNSLAAPPGRAAWAGWTAAAACLLVAAIYVSHAFPKESSGSIAAKKKVSRGFRALNGVNVIVRDREAIWLPGLRDAILKHSSPGEYVLCLPYSPTINFMTDRPSPLHNLYVDNTVGEKTFHSYFLDLVAKSPPAVIVVNQRKINGTEISRFQNWAPLTYGWIWENYVFVGRYHDNEVFVRRDKCAGGIAPEYIGVSN